MDYLSDLLDSLRSNQYSQADIDRYAAMYDSMAQDAYGGQGDNAYGEPNSPFAGDTRALMGDAGYKNAAAESTARRRSDQTLADENRKLNELLSSRTIRTDGYKQPVQQPQQSAPQLPENYIQNTRTGKVTALPSGYDPRYHDVWVDGPQKIHEEQLADGRKLVTERVPVRDRFGRQSSDVRQRIVGLTLAEQKTMAEIAKLQAEAGKVTAEARGGKPLSMEAKIKTDYQAGRISKEEFDIAMAGTPSGKQAEKVANARKDKMDTARSSIDMFDQIQRNVNQLYDPATKKLTPEATSLFGKFDQYRGDLLLGEKSVDALAALDSLQNQLTMMNLADAKKRVDQSFGSMQVKEWDKFVGLLTSLKRSKSEATAAKDFEYITDFINKKRDVMNAALGIKQDAAAPASNTGNAAKPTLQEWMQKARATNPNASGAELEQYYYKKYGGK